MKKHIKLFVVALTILVFATGCSVLPTDKSDEKIIQTIKDKMKTEMDRIGFTVNFDDYEFTLRKSGAYVYGGWVYLKDKRYDQEPVIVYDGNFEKLDIEKIGADPLAFVYAGYLDYLDTVNAEALKLVEDYLSEKGEVYAKDEYDKGSFRHVVSWTPHTIRIVNDEPAEKWATQVFLYTGAPLDLNAYINYYYNKRTDIFDYASFDKYNSDATIYSYSMEGYEKSKLYMQYETEIKNLLRTKGYNRIFVGIV